MEALVYKATSPSNKTYIGITAKSLEERRKRHFSDASYKNASKFHKALNKYGSRISWEVLDHVDSWETAKILEQNYIEKFNSYRKGYNSTKGGDGVLGQIPSNKGKKLKNTENFKNSKELRLKKAISRGAKSFLVFGPEEELIGKFINQRECARFLGIPKSYVWRCLKGIKKSAKGYTFRFEGEQ